MNLFKVNTIHLTKSGRKYNKYFQNPKKNSLFLVKYNQTTIGSVYYNQYGFPTESTVNRCLAIAISGTVCPVSITSWQHEVYGQSEPDVNGLIIYQSWGEIGQ